MESKAQLRKRLIDEGRWEDFTAARERLKAEGQSSAEAHRGAVELFPPLTASQRAEADQAARESHQALAELVAAVRRRPADAANTDLRQRAVAEWVFEHAQVDLAAIEAADVPSCGALGLLVWVQTSPANYGAFLSQIWSKLLPTRQQIEQTNRYTDDGRGLEQLDQFEQAWSEERAAGVAGPKAAGPEPGVSQSAVKLGDDPRPPA